MLNVPANFESLQLHSDFGAVGLPDSNTQQHKPPHCIEIHGKLAQGQHGSAMDFFLVGLHLSPGYPHGVVVRSDEESTDGSVGEKALLVPTHLSKST